MTPRPPLCSGPGPAPLPFGGLGLDLAEVRRKTSTLRLKAWPARQPQARIVPPPAPPAYSGYGLLVRLCRETLGS